MSKAHGSGIVRRAVRGAISGAVGLAAMDLLLYSRYRRGGGKDPFLRWEFAGAVLGWADASAPGQLGQKVERIVTRAAAPRALGADHDERRALGHRHRLGRPVRRAGRPVLLAPRPPGRSRWARWCGCPAT